MSEIAFTDKRPRWEVTLWPNCSETRGGNAAFLVILGCGFAFFAMMTVFAPNYVGSEELQYQVLGVIAAAMSIVMIALAVAFLRNQRDAEYREHLSIESGTLTIEAAHPNRLPRRWQFPSYWTRVQTQTMGRVENRLILQHGNTAVAIGEFLTPEERLSLAEEIERALTRTR